MPVSLRQVYWPKTKWESSRFRILKCYLVEKVFWHKTRFSKIICLLIGLLWGRYSRRRRRQDTFREIIYAENVIWKIYLFPHGSLTSKAYVLVFSHPRIPTANTLAWSLCSSMMWSSANGSGRSLRPRELWSLLMRKKGLC